MFSGGTGTDSITNALLERPQVSLTLLVNAYDDGRSTGRMRAFLPGMLGPSDIRKNVARLVPADEAVLRELLRARLPRRCDERLAHEWIRTALALLQPTHAIIFSRWCEFFWNYVEAQRRGGRRFRFGDCAVGNIIFAGCYLACNRNFNAAIDDFGKHCGLRGKVVNVTDGANLILVGLSQGGSFMVNEAAIASEHAQVPIREIFLLEPGFDACGIKRLSGERMRRVLAASQRSPRPNPGAERALKTADLILYGPGTQHSSLFPSYLTEGIAEAIAANRKAKKIFIVNLHRDADLTGETVASLIDKFLFYMNRKGALNLPLPDLVDSFFVNSPKGSDDPLAIPLGRLRHMLPAGGFIVRDWSRGTDFHSGGHVVSEALRTVRADGR